MHVGRIVRLYDFKITTVITASNCGSGSPVEIPGSKQDNTSIKYELRWEMHSSNVVATIGYRVCSTRGMKCSSKGPTVGRAFGSAPIVNSRSTNVQSLILHANQSAVRPLS